MVETAEVAGQLGIVGHIEEGSGTKLGWNEGERECRMDKNLSMPDNSLAFFYSKHECLNSCLATSVDQV